MNICPFSSLLQQFMIIFDLKKELKQLGRIIIKMDL